MADLRYRLCDAPYPLAGNDGRCRQECDNGQLMVFKDLRFTCVESCASLNDGYAIGSMESLASGLKYATCVTCNAIRETRNGQTWCIDRCTPSKEISSAADVENVNKALIHIDGEAWCVNPQDYADSDCKYLYNRQTGDFECLAEPSYYKPVIIEDGTETRMLVSNCPLDGKYFLSEDYKYCYEGACPATYKGYFINDVTPQCTNRCTSKNGEACEPPMKAQQSPHSLWRPFRLFPRDEASARAIIANKSGTQTSASVAKAK